jgi:predicted alpha/beta superfamily hydrolase
MKQYPLFICLLWAIVALTPATAQYGAPQKDSLYSTVLGEQRDIVITLPTNYASDTAHYDVWYQLDGEWDGPLFTQIYGYMVNMSFAPPAILVAVPNRYVNGFNLRDRDLTPTKFADVDSSGGAANYLLVCITVPQARMSGGGTPWCGGKHFKNI